MQCYTLIRACSSSSLADLTHSILRVKERGILESQDGRNLGIRVLYCFVVTRCATRWSIHIDIGLSFSEYAVQTGVVDSVYCPSNLG